MFATEYGRECKRNFVLPLHSLTELGYCGNTLEYGSVPASGSECNFPCGGNSLESCGAGLRLNLYTLRQKSTLRDLGPRYTTTSTSISVYVASFSSSSSLHSPTHASSSTLLKHRSPSRISTAYTRSTLSASKPISSHSPVSARSVSTSKSARTSSTLFLTSPHWTTSSPKYHPNQPFAKTLTAPLPAHTPPWSYIGCFGNIPRNELYLLKKSHKMNPDLCISAALARKTAIPATLYSYVGVERGIHCYGATAAPSPIPTILVGEKACASTCRGSVVGASVDMCGGWRQYDFYASETGKVFSRPVPTETPR
jgi:hypothetical protein